MKIKLALVLSILATAPSFADVGDGSNSITTLSGRTYRGVAIAEVKPDGVFFRHSNGAGKVLFSDLPSDVRQSLGYDAKKAESYEKEIAARRERERLASIERDKEIAKAQASASAASAAQARLIQAQYIAAADQQSANYGYGMSYPIVWGYGGGYGGSYGGGYGRGGSTGWYNERIPSPSYGGRAYYTVKRPVPSTSPYVQPFSAGRSTHGGPYSPGHEGKARFTNGVPALSSSFSHAPARHSGPAVTGTGSRPIGSSRPAKSR